jgi:hypothetical protein
MVNRERIPPLLACRSGVLTSFPDQAAPSRDTDREGIPGRAQRTPHNALSGMDLKASVGLSTQPYVSGLGYMVAREEYESFSYRDISSCMVLVPIRDDPEMVLNLGLRVAEAGLQRLGVAA